MRLLQAAIIQRSKNFGVETSLLMNSAGKKCSFTQSLSDNSRTLFCKHHKSLLIHEIARDRKSIDLFPRESDFTHINQARIKTKISNTLTAGLNGKCLNKLPVVVCKFMVGNSKAHQINIWRELTFNARHLFHRFFTSLNFNIHEIPNRKRDIE